MRVLAGILLIVHLTSCSGSTDPRGADPFEPSDAALLSIDSPGKDEDPSVLRTRDGRMIVAWFSDRGGNADIYLSATDDGVDWLPARRVTVDQAGDFYPFLIEDEQGTVHLAWFRWTTLNVGSIYYSQSADGVTWDPTTEVRVTEVALVDDWVPSITAGPGGSLLIYFASRARDPQDGTSKIYVSRLGPADSDWAPAELVSGINSATEHDHLPYATRTGGVVTLTWTRNDLRSDTPWTNPKADVYVAMSSDGLAWSEPVRVTTEPGDVVNVFPVLYQTFANDWRLAWLSTRTGTPRVFEMPLTSVAQYPAGRNEIEALPPGYSHRIAATPRDGVYLGAWVQGVEGSQDVWYRFFSR